MNGKKTVLIVAQHFVTAETFERSLLKKGYDVVRLSGETALAWLHRERADVVFLDDSLPDFSVAEVARTLRDQQETRFTPLVILLGRKAIAEGAKRSPTTADLYVPSSLDPKRVVALVGMLVEDGPLIRRSGGAAPLDA